MDTPNSNNQPQGVPPKNTTDGASQYLQYVAKQQAQKGLDMEREVVLRDTDAAAPNRQNATQCWSCNKLTYVSFVPDGKRPVYCKNCLHDMRMKKAEMQGDAPDASPNSYTPKPALAFKPKSSFVITPKSEIQKPQQVTPPALPKVTKSQVPEAPSKNVEPKPQEVQEISLKKLTPGQVVKFHQKS